MNPSPFTITCVQLFFSSQAPKTVSLSLVCVSTVCPTVLKRLFLQYRVLSLLLCCRIS